jgi:hypothetical protein
VSLPQVASLAAIIGAVATIYFGWRRHVRGERLAREAAKPLLLIRPDYPNGDDRPRFHYSAGLENEDKVVTIRAVRPEARMDGESVGTTAAVQSSAERSRLRRRLNRLRGDGTGAKEARQPPRMG